MTRANSIYYKRSKKYHKNCLFFLFFYTNVIFPLFISTLKVIQRILNDAQENKSGDFITEGFS